jgi:hypothetical protein
MIREHQSLVSHHIAQYRSPTNQSKSRLLVDFVFRWFLKRKPETYCEMTLPHIYFSMDAHCTLHTMFILFFSITLPYTSSHQRQSLETNQNCNAPIPTGAQHDSLAFDRRPELFITNGVETRLSLLQSPLTETKANWSSSETEFRSDGRTGGKY